MLDLGRLLLQVALRTWIVRRQPCGPQQEVQQLLRPNQAAATALMMVVVGVMEEEEVGVVAACSTSAQCKGVAMA